MRILWITPGFAANEQDYNCIPPMQGLARELLRQGLDLHIVALEYPFTQARGLNFSNFKLKKTSPQPPEKFQWLDATVYPCKGQNRRVLRWRTHSRARRFAQQLFSEKKFDAIHSFWLGPAWLIGEQLARGWNIPHFCTLMGQDVLPANWWYLRRLKPEHTSRLIALSRFHNNKLEASRGGLRAAHCIPWGIEQQDNPLHFSVERPIDILGVGSLVSVKNWVRWLRVLRLVADKKPEIRAELIGGGPQQPELQALVERYQLNKQVSLIGNLPRPQVLERMRQSRVLLHTSNFESFGFVFPEAIVNGCRVVSTPVGIAPELVVCADTDAGLTEAVLQALDQDNLKTPARYLLMEDVGKQYLNLYSDKT